MYLDVGWLRPKNKENRLYKPYWRIIVDERTQMKHSAFFNTKKGMVEPTCELFQHWRATGQSVQHVRLDNAGENKRLQQRSESADWKLGIHYEFTDARTPQKELLGRSSISDHFMQRKSYDGTCQYANGYQIQSLSRMYDYSYTIGWINSD